MEKLLIIGTGPLVIAAMILALAPGLTGPGIGVARVGPCMGLSGKLLPAPIADTAPDDPSGTAFGVVNPATGGTFFAVSTLAGLCCRSHGSAATFPDGDRFAAVATFARIVRWDQVPPWRIPRP